jgi:hypothetical protein
MIGDKAAGMITFEVKPCHLTALPPAAARVAPITPPMSACDELDGMPNSQVIRFQMSHRCSLGGFWGLPGWGWGYETRLAGMAGHRRRGGCRHRTSGQGVSGAR